MPTCQGWSSSTGKRCCVSWGLANGRCKSHQNQCKGYKTDGIKCGAKAPEGDDYCRTLHDPSYKEANLFVSPHELRNHIPLEMRQEVVATYGEKDAYTNKPIKGDENMDHVGEVQLGAEGINKTWKPLKDRHGDDQVLEDVVTFVRDDLVNDLENLRFTSKDINQIKGAACTRMIEVQRKGDIVTTFTDCMLTIDTKHGSRVGRDTTRTIRTAMRAALKRWAYKTDGNSDSGLVFEGLSSAFQGMQVSFKE